jgi:hypothetical protein
MEYHNSSAKRKICDGSGRDVKETIGCPMEAVTCDSWNATVTGPLRVERKEGCLSPLLGDGND